MKSHCYLVSLVLFTLFPCTAMANATTPLEIPKFDHGQVAVAIDGVLDENVWHRVPSYDEMVVLEPDTLKDPPRQTKVRFFYTEKGLYLGAWAEQDVATLVSRLSSRDQFIQRDDISFTLDPSGEGLYGYWFGVALGGTLQDGTVLPERQYSNEWDGAWYGASATHDQGWSAEFFLPWSMMSMPETPGDTREMGFYISRKVAHKDERWAWPTLPKTRQVFLSQLKKIKLEGIDPKQQFTFYPFASATYDNSATEDRYQTGFDIFWRPSSNLQLTATVNPDFGNVESDDVVVNLTSLETFFPEKRPFFLEGNEIFVTSPRAQEGTPTTLVNTRRIGGPPKLPDIPDLVLTDLEENQPSALDGAAKVTGQVGNFRYGALAAMEEDTKIEGSIGGQEVDILQDGRDFAVARLLYESTLNGGRRALGAMTTLVAHPQGDAITHGIDAHYLSADGRWNTDAQLMFSDTANITGTGGFVDIDYSPSRGKQHELGLEYFDDELDINDLGFLRRNDSIGGTYRYTMTESDVPELKRRTTELQLLQRYNTEGQVVNSGVFTQQRRDYRNNSFFKLELNFYPERWDDINSEGNGAFRIVDRWHGGFSWGSDQSRPLGAEFSAYWREEDLGGLKQTVSFDLSWRPSDRFSVTTTLAYEDRDGWLIHTGGRTFTTYLAHVWRPNLEMDFFLTAKQQFRLTAQWAGIKAHEQDRWLVPEQDGELEAVSAAAGSSSRDFTISRLTFQARYRWEIAPLSDLFVVYTRGSNVDSRPGESFDALLQDSWTEPLVDVLVVKLRYRLGN